MFVKTVVPTYLYGKISLIMLMLFSMWTQPCLYICLFMCILFDGPVAFMYNKLLNLKSLLA